MKVGDKVYLFKIEAKDDQVRYFIITCGTYDVNLHGSTRQTRYKALLSFELGKSFLDTASAESVKQVVDRVVAPEAELNAASTKTVELGQTPEQVKADIGPAGQNCESWCKEDFRLQRHEDRLCR